MKKGFLIILGIILIAVGIISFSEFSKRNTQLAELSKRITQLTAQVEEQASTIRFYEEDIREYEEFNNLVIKTFSSQELKVIAEDLWNYELQVNEQPFPNDGKANIKGSNFEISLSERQPGADILNPKAMELGQLRDYSSHLEIDSPVSYEPRGYDGTVVHGVHYIFKDVEPGTTINISVSPELQKRLGLHTGKVIIVVD